VKGRRFEPSVALANESLIRTGCKDGILPQAGNDGRVISGRERSRAPPASSSMSARRRFLPGFSAAICGGFPALVARLFTEGREVRGVERGRIALEIAPDRALGNRDRREDEGLGKGPDRTDEPAGKVRDLRS
jgi:hypothetical protein